MLSSKFLINNSCNYQNAHVKSHKYMLKTGMIVQVASGIYTWSPFGMHVLRKIENIIHFHHKKNNVLEFLSPIAQPCKLWHESGRYDSYGEEALRFHDRNNQEFIFGPTAEEIAALLMNTFGKTGIPIYQIQWKFRDEERPRYGLLRGREFLMKDAYSFEKSQEEAMKKYIMFFNIYMDIFSDLKLKVYPFLSDSGPIGGSYTHEFVVLSNVGESKLKFEDNMKHNMKFHEYNNQFGLISEDYNAKGIEVGQIFIIGEKYTKDTVMGCYGIGVSRLIQVIVEEYFDEKNNRMHWPDSIRMIDIAFISGDESNEAEKMYEFLLEKEKNIMYDDRNIKISEKINDMKILGAKYICVVRKNNIRCLKNDEWSDITEKEVYHLL